MWMILGFIFTYLLLGTIACFIGLVVENERVTLGDLIDGKIGILLWPFVLFFWALEYLNTHEIVLWEKKKESDPNERDLDLPS